MACLNARLRLKSIDLELYNNKKKEKRERKDYRERFQERRHWCVYGLPGFLHLDRKKEARPPKPA